MRRKRLIQKQDLNMERLKVIKSPPLKDKFEKFGDTFELVSKNESSRIYCYRRTTPEDTVYFEVFRSNLEKDDNGKDYEYYPKSSQFGVSAWCIRSSMHAQEKIQKYMQKLSSASGQHG